MYQQMTDEGQPEASNIQKMCRNLICLDKKIVFKLQIMSQEKRFLSTCTTS